jgi:hypothetical protein
VGIEEHHAQVKEWERKYGKPSNGLRQFNPMLIKVCCSKCGKLRKRMSRHHKGAEFMFALRFPDWYAARYIRFLPEDCVRLCSTCHKKIERLTKPLKNEFRDWYNYMWCQGKIPTHEQVEKFRKRIVARCEHWLSGKRGRPCLTSSAA